MNKAILSVLFMAASAACLFAGPLSGRRVPSFTLPDARANYHDILDYRGKVVLVDVMQTACPHCQELATQLEKVQAKYGDKVPILAIVVPPDTLDTVKQFATRYNVRYPIMFDCGQVTATLMKATPSKPQVTFPHLFLVDQNGMIRQDFDWDKDQAIITGPGLIQSIDKLLSAAPASVPAKPVKK